jgi:hypothetical protein
VFFAHKAAISEAADTHGGQGTGEWFSLYTFGLLHYKEHAFPLYFRNLLN